MSSSEYLEAVWCRGGAQPRKKPREMCGQHRGERKVQRVLGQPLVPVLVPRLTFYIASGKLLSSLSLSFLVSIIPGLPLCGVIVMSKDNSMDIS